MIRIMFAVNGQWQQLLGHNCRTLYEADAYVKELGGDYMYVDRGQKPPPCPLSDVRPLRVDAITRNMILEAFKDF